MPDELKRTPGEEPETVDTGASDPQPTSETPDETTNPSSQDGESIEALRRQLDEANKARGRAVYELGEKNKQTRELENRFSQLEAKLGAAKGSEDAKYLKEQIELLETEIREMKTGGERVKFEAGKQAIIEEVLADVPEAKDFILSMQPDFEYATTPKGIEKWENADEALDYVKWKLSEAKKRYLAKRQSAKPVEPGTQPTNPPVVKTRTPNLEELYNKALATGDTYAALKLKKQLAFERSQR
jgi:hypothetical protein